MWEQQPPPPPPPRHQTTPDLIRHHHHHQPSHAPQFHPTFPQPQPHQPLNYPDNFYPNNLHQHPPPPPGFRPPPSVPIHRPITPNFHSPNCTPPIHQPVDFRVSWPDHHHQQRSLNPDEFRYPSRRRDEWDPYRLSQRFDSVMDVDRRGRYDDSAGSNYCRSSRGYGGYYAQRDPAPVDFRGDAGYGGWGSKRQRYEDVPRSVYGARNSGYERAVEGFVARRVEGNIRDLHGKVQRKSALLRIVDTSAHSGYPIKKSKSSGQGSSSKTSPFKAKYLSPAKHEIKKEGENSPRENNPVHVSFKSNSLVANQIVTPSSPVDITNSSGTPRSRKLGKSAAPGVVDLIISSHEVKHSPMKLPNRGLSSQNPSHRDKINELTEASDSGAVNKNLSDISSSPAVQMGRFDADFSVDNCNTGGSNFSAKKRRKKRKLSEFTAPLSKQLIDEQSGGFRSFSPTKIMNDKDSKGSCCLLPTSSIETLSLVSHPLSSQHIGEATTEFSMKHCSCKRSDNQESQLPNECCCKETMTDIPAAKVNENDCCKRLDNQESQLPNECCCKETMTDIPAAKVNENDRSEHPQDKCIQISPLEADILCNTISDQTYPKGIIEKGSLDEHTVTFTVDYNNKVDQGVGFGLASMRERKERNTQFDFSDSMPAATALENDLSKKETIDSDKSVCASPDLVKMEKEVACVVDESVVSSDVSFTNVDFVTPVLKEATPHSICDDRSTMVPVSSKSLALHKDGFIISNLAQGSSESAKVNEIAISNTKAGSDPDEQSTMAPLERIWGGKTISSNARFDKKIVDVALGSDKNAEGNSLGGTKLGRTMQMGTLPSVSSDINSIKSTHGTSGNVKYQKGYALHAPFRTSSYVCFASPKLESSKMHPIKSRTWHRSDNDSSVTLSSKASGSNLVPPPSHPLKSGKPQGTSYIRKGNSLVRNPSPVSTFFRGPEVSTHPTDQPTFSVEENKGSSENKVDSTLGHHRFGSSDNLHNIQTYKAGQSFDKTSACISDTCPVKPLDISPMRHIANSYSESNADPTRAPDGTGLVELHDEVNLKEITENQCIPTNSFGTHAAEGICISTKAACVLHPTHDLCQLISASGPSHLAVEKAQNNQIVSSDGYYKTRMNQIIRTPLDSAQTLPLSNCNSDKEGMHAQNVVNRTSSVQSYKGTLHISSNSSVVWTLHGAKPMGKSTQGHLQCKKPWRDARNSGASLNRRASSMLRKLTLYRNQNTLYKRSTHGLSLRKYKVLALGGCSLKWSKSIERRSKKANEDATRAVVAAESVKKVQSCARGTVFRKETNHHTSSKSAYCVTPHPRGRIFRIGSLRYRMDPSRKTLRRVIDDGSARGDFEDKDSKIAYVPTRLAIGKNEYIRIGNGNQLVRDPKKRIRMLANEKIRWSLHNVRQRSTKKRRFCQFYTRFGKCNKDDGKCPYIHDSSKVAVCTKFLKGMCSDLGCKLTHKVIPERMEDCSYFLQGMCSNESCPYRHVNVNPKAATCEGFLRGYCADGDECRKKHSYVCHVYEENGSCPEGSKCKLHHPKKQKAKLTSSRLQNFSKGRYFGNPALEVLDPQAVEPLKLSSTRSSAIFKDGEIPEFISLEDDDDDVNVIEDISCSSKHDDSDMETEVFDLNTLIKPIRIMNKDVGAIDL